MRDPILERKLASMGAERQSMVLGLPLLLMLMPVLTFAGLTQYTVGYVSPTAFVAALAIYACVLSLGTWTIRREVALNTRANTSDTLDKERLAR